MLDNEQIVPAAAHTTWWHTGDVVFGLPLLAAIALQWVLPLPFSFGFLFPVAIVAGVVLVIVGMIVIILARREFAQYSQPTDPGRPTSGLVSSGVFAFSRNPIYIGALCVLIGIAVAGGLLWVFVLLIPTLVACHYVLIAPEERYLAATFGEEYESYTRTVHRWIGRR